MIKKAFITLIFMFYLLSAFSQTLNNTELYNLQALVSIFLMDQDSKPSAKTERSSEFITCLLQIDSNGKVNNIYIFADDKNKDSTYSYLNRMSPLV